MAKKFNAKGIVTKVLVAAGTGAGVQVLESLAGLDEKTSGMILVGAGAILPEVMKNNVVSQVADASLAVGAYKLAKEYDVASMLGISSDATTTTATTAGFRDTNNIGRTWEPVRKNPAPKQADKATSSNVN